MHPLMAMKAPTGYWYMVRVPHYWGKGETMMQALANLRKAGASGDITFGDVFLVDPEARLDDVTGSYIERPKDGKPAIQIGEIRLSK